MEFCLSSSRLAVGSMHKLSTNDPGRKDVIMWCMTTYGLKFWMFRAILPNLSMNSLRDSPFSWKMLTRVKKVRWCGWLVTNCVPNFDTSVLKQSMEFGGSLVSQLKGPSFSEVRNTPHRTAVSEVYKLICMMYTFMCSSRSVVLSYRSMLKPFHTAGSYAPIMWSVNGCQRNTSNVLVMGTDLFR